MLTAYLIGFIITTGAGIGIAASEEYGVEDSISELIACVLVGFIWPISVVAIIVLRLVDND